MLILEGPDGVGKTTLAKKLLKELPRHIYAHFSRLPVDFDYYWDYVARMSRYIVQDRFHMSEIVYQEVRGDPVKLTPDVYRMVDARLRQLGGMTVLITASQSLIRSRWDSSQMYNLELTLKAASNFNSIALNQRISSIDVDFHFHCSEANPYVTDNQVMAVVDEYRRRQGVLSELIGRRPTSL